MFLLGLSRDRMLGRREWAVPFDGERTTSKNGGEAPHFSSLRQGSRVGTTQQVDLKSGYSASLRPDKEVIHRENKKPVSLAPPVRPLRPDLSLQTPFSRLCVLMQQ